MATLSIKNLTDYKIIYKSGDGESFIEYFYVLENEKYVNRTQDIESEEVESKHHRSIFEHDHDNNTGYGKIVVQNGKIITDIYQSDF